MGHAETCRGPESKLHSCVKCKPNPRDMLSHKGQDVSVVCFPSSMPLHTCVQGKGGAHCNKAVSTAPRPGSPAHRCFCWVSEMNPKMSDLCCLGKSGAMGESTAQRRARKGIPMGCRGRLANAGRSEQCPGLQAREQGGGEERRTQGQIWRAESMGLWTRRAQGKA